MSYNEIPLTVTEEPKAIKEKRKEIQLKEIQSKIEENIPVAVARIVKFLNNNKDKTFTNRQIALEVGISGSSVSGIMDKLEEIGCVKVVKVRKHLSAGISQVYQSAKGTSKESIKEREAKGYVAHVLEAFKNNKNKCYTKKEIANIIEESQCKVGAAISILLVTEKIKVVGIENDTLIYQYITGKNPTVKIHTEPNKSYITLGNYLKMNGIKGDLKEIKSKIVKENKYSRFFYSDKGIVKEYEISYLQKVIGLKKLTENKKGILEKVISWGSKI